MCERDASPRTGMSGPSDADAKAYTVTAYLEGADGWAPHRRTTH